MSRKKIKIVKIPACPHCSSLRTGEISNYVVTRTEQKKIEKKHLEKGYFIKFVTPERYRTYYSVYHINCFCNDCDYEFSGKMTTEKLNKEDYVKYLEDRKIDEELCLYKDTLFSKFLQVLRYLIPFG